MVPHAHTHTHTHTHNIMVQLIYYTNTHIKSAAQNEDELAVNAGEAVLILGDLGDGWLRVRKNREEGYVPESYVQKDE